MNKHGLKLKHKNIVRLLKDLYEKKFFIDRKLTDINAKIYRLETAKNNCGEQIKELNKK